jgi:hypothetical protein
MKKFDLLRVPKEIEIIGMDISELGGVNEEVYSKLRKDFSLFTPFGSPNHSTYVPSGSRVIDKTRNSVNRPYNGSEDGDEEVVIQNHKMVFNSNLKADHEIGKFNYD